MTKIPPEVNQTKPSDDHYACPEGARSEIGTEVQVTSCGSKGLWARPLTNCTGKEITIVCDRSSDISGVFGRLPGGKSACVHLRNVESWKLDVCCVGETIISYGLNWRYIPLFSNIALIPTTLNPPGGQLQYFLPGCLVTGFTNLPIMVQTYFVKINPYW